MEEILRKRFAREPKGELLAEDFIFEVGREGPLAGFRIDHADVALIERPLAVRRESHLASEAEVLRVVLYLCLEGAAIAHDWLFAVGSAFQREPEPEAIQSLDLGPGTVGFSWAWSADGSAAFAAFVRHNVVVTLDGHLDTIRATVFSLDRALRGLKTTPIGGRPTPPEARTVGRIAAGGRLDLPFTDEPGMNLFFVATGGAVNRDPALPGRYYFRAGLERGTHTVESLRVGRGLLPQRTRLTVEIG